MMITVKVKTPQVPSFLLFKEMEGKISIADVPNDELRDIASDWAEKLIAHAEKLRQNR